jgi:hypothetical protein
MNNPRTQNVLLLIAIEGLFLLKREARFLSEATKGEQKADNTWSRKP